MDSLLITELTIAIAYFLENPLLLLLHELGHALTALALSRQPVQVYLGTTPHQVKRQAIQRKPTLTIGKLALYLFPFRFFFVGRGWTSWSSRLSRRQHILALLAGPATSLLCLIVSASLTYAHGYPLTIQISDYNLLQWLTLYALLHFLGTAIPFRWKLDADGSSDGYKIITLLQTKE